MGISVQASEVIERQIEDVFAFISNMENSPLWDRTIKTTKVSDGPVSVGTVFREEDRIMGRRTNSQAEVTEFDPPTRFSFTGRFENGWEERAVITFEAVDEGTRMNFTGEGEMGKVGDVLAPILSWQMKRQVHSLFKNLKDLLEAPDGPFFRCEVDKSLWMEEMSQDFNDVNAT
jgi:uncharacterized protein YndB with AHSA1/START domain